MLPNMDWTDAAACKGKPLEWFFPTKGGTLRQAKALCARCPVVQQCRDATDIMENGATQPVHVHGFFGGESPNQRMARRGAAQPEAVA